MKINEPKYKILKSIIALTWFMFVYHVLVAFMVALVSFVKYENLFLLPISEWDGLSRLLYGLLFITVFIYSIVDGWGDKNEN